MIALERRIRELLRSGEQGRRLDCAYVFHRNGRRVKGALRELADGVCDGRHCRGEAPWPDRSWVSLLKHFCSTILAVTEGNSPSAYVCAAPGSMVQRCRKRGKIFKSLVLAYDLRSRAVHSGNTPEELDGVPSSKILETGYGLTVAAVEKIIRLGKNPDWTDVVLD